MLCQKVHEECASSWKGELPKETIGHIQSAGCLGQKEVVTAAHNACIRELRYEIAWQGMENSRRYKKKLFHTWCLFHTIRVFKLLRWYEYLIPHGVN
jgi:hypothetical protein